MLSWIIEETKNVVVGIIIVVLFALFTSIGKDFREVFP